MANKIMLVSWQPIETAPKDVAVLVCTKTGVVVIAYVYPGGAELADSERTIVETLTHWMPLPCPPEGC